MTERAITKSEFRWNASQVLIRQQFAARMAFAESEVDLVRSGVADAIQTRRVLKLIASLTQT
jgi:hypothetical protein